MIRVPLTRGKVAFVSNQDAAQVRKFQWSALRVKSGLWYAHTQLKNREWIYLHRLVMGFPLADVDHKDLNGLNCQRGNLRCASRSNNMANRNKPRHNTSGFKGVTWDSRRSRWAAQITVAYRHIFLGYFLDICAAAQAYRDAASKNFGTFARA